MRTVKLRTAKLRTVKPAAPTALRAISRVDVGWASLRRGDWDEARRTFEAALRSDDDARALEGLGLAGWWLDRADLVFDSRERAFRLYMDAGDRVSAARIAVWIAWDSAAFRGEMAVANGWLARARRVLHGVPASASHAWIELRAGVFALLHDGDPDLALRHANSAVRIARRVGDFDLEMVGRALGGFALVTAGQVPAGMVQLDEVNAAVLADELEDPIAIGLSGCYLVGACERVHDTERAVQWCDHLKKYCTAWGLRPLLSVCRTQYASVCVWRGDWAEAELELTAATADMATSRPAMTGEGLARLGELRRRQGRVDDALSLFDQAGAHPIALAGAAALALDAGDARRAANLADRLLRHVPRHNRTERVPALEVLVRARVALGALPQAKAAAAELAAIGRKSGTLPLRAAAAAAAGAVLAAEDRHDDARRRFEDAVDLYARSGAPFETARARIDLAESLAAGGALDAARDEVRRASAMLTRIAAAHELARIESLNARLRPQAATAADGTARAVLSRRELDVVRLIARGQNNARIARTLAISTHTVHRHVANILTKLDVPSRSAAVARAATLRLL